MRYVIAMVLMSLAMASSAQALTFKKGEVLGSNGKTYQSASPEQISVKLNVPRQMTCQLAWLVTMCLWQLETRFLSSRLAKFGAQKTKPSSRLSVMSGAGHYGQRKHHF